MARRAPTRTSAPGWWRRWSATACSSRSQPGYEFAPHLRLESAPGHRPGHAAVWIGDEFVHGGDILHVVEHVANPAWDYVLRHRRGARPRRPGRSGSTGSSRPARRCSSRTSPPAAGSLPAPRGSPSNDASSSASTAATRRRSRWSRTATAPSSARAARAAPTSTARRRPRRRSTRSPPRRRARCRGRGVTGDELDAAVFCLAGADWPEDFELHHRELTARLVAASSADGLQRRHRDAAGRHAGRRRRRRRGRHRRRHRRPQRARRDLAPRVLARRHGGRRDRPGGLRAVYRNGLGHDVPTTLTAPGAASCTACPTRSSCCTASAGAGRSRRPWRWCRWCSRRRPRATRSRARSSRPTRRGSPTPCARRPPSSAWRRRTRWCWRVACCGIRRRRCTPTRSRAACPTRSPCGRRGSRRSARCCWHATRSGSSPYPARAAGVAARGDVLRHALGPVTRTEVLPPRIRPAAYGPSRHRRTVRADVARLRAPPARKRSGVRPQ